jgi:hypothetical protein
LGYNQCWGYVLSAAKLLKMTAHKTKIIEPSKAGVSKNFQSGLVIITTKATAPEGGCRVLVICIIPIALETAIPYRKIGFKAPSF